jgi:hypothetical protein
MDECSFTPALLLVEAEIQAPPTALCKITSTIDIMANEARVEELCIWTGIESSGVNIRARLLNTGRVRKITVKMIILTTYAIIDPSRMAHPAEKLLAVREIRTGVQ